MDYPAGFKWKPGQLPDPMIGRTSDESSCIGLSNAIRLSIEIHNPDATGDDVITAGVLPERAVYIRLLNVMGGILASHEFFMEHVGNKTYRDIRKVSYRMDFQKAEYEVFKTFTDAEPLATAGDGG